MNTFSLRSNRVIQNGLEMTQAIKVKPVNFAMGSKRI